MNEIKLKPELYSPEKAKVLESANHFESWPGYDKSIVLLLLPVILFLTFYFCFIGGALLAFAL